MAQITLKLHEILTLEAELNGFVNPNTGEKVLDGFLKEKLNLGTKYRLTKLSEELKKEKAILDGLREDLIKELGEEKDGQVSIPTFEDKKQTKAKRHGQYPYTVAYTYDGSDMPSRQQFFQQLAEKHEVK